MRAYIYKLRFGICVVAAAITLSGCVYYPAAPGYGYAYAPAPAYYGPAYYGPPVSIGFGYGGGWHGGGRWR